MENKINVAELLKDCPKGIKLYSPLCGECTFKHVHNELEKIIISTSDNATLTFNNNGAYFQLDNAECLLFPSKENRDWSKFQRPFKDGDILAYDNKMPYMSTVYIYRSNDKWNTSYYVAVDSSGEFYNDGKGALNSNCDRVRLATKEERERLFQAIKDHGYRWNVKTKTLEKIIIPKFKVGDRVKKNNDYINGIVTDIFDDSFKVTYRDGGYSCVQFHYQCDWELVHDKFDISSLKPFDKVLARNNGSCVWKCSLYSHYSKYPYHCICTDNGYKQCIPYEGNEHLRGTTNDCDEYYKTW